MNLSDKEILGRSQGRQPRATYRLQFNERFTLRDALGRLDYLYELGISHVYASPLLAAVPHSPHGYDICDFHRLNPELGTEEDLETLANRLHELGMGILLDIVPNHMGIGSSRNSWWWDVLARGRNSRFADYFDIDWEGANPQCRGKVLMPVLADRYHRVLGKGDIRLCYEGGEFMIRYMNHLFPVSHESHQALWDSAENPGFQVAESPAFGAERVNGMLRRSFGAQLRDASILEVGDTRAAWARKVVERINGDVELLSALLDWQFYRLTYWHHGDVHLNYRRFFSISSLAGLRTEREEVFRQTHALPLRWLRQGWLDGFRVDHPDGLRSPTQYLARLRCEAPHAWIVVEKILAEHETLPSTWKVDGTTGYDFLNQAGRLFVDSKAENRLDQFYRDFTGETVGFAALVRRSKRSILNQSLGAETRRLSGLLEQIAAGQWRWCDFTREEIEDALVEMLASFPVYRAYRSDIRESSKYGESWDYVFGYVRQAGAAARLSRPDIDVGLFDFLERLLLSRLDDPRAEEFAARFQQVASSTMAKGVEDTAFYSFNRLVCLNEVGGNPGEFGTSPSQFHSFCRQLGGRFPNSLLATSTHDTKRSEDTRMRIATLSVNPRVWERFVRRISRHNERHRSGVFPDRNVEYLYYQSLAGAWPVSVDRMAAYMEKAAREASIHTHWKSPCQGYESALRNFVERTMADGEFVREFELFITPVARAALVNSLSLLLLKLTAPGVPDFYQGTELWYYRLVDPDNRQPVDFAVLERALERVGRVPGKELWEDPDDGLVKMWLIRTVLRLRQDEPETLGGEASYAPIPMSGGYASHAVAYIRNDHAVTVAPRLIGPGHVWREEFVELPDVHWKHLFTGEEFPGGKVRLDRLFREFPVALLWKLEKHE